MDEQDATATAVVSPAPGAGVRACTLLVLLVLAAGTFREHNFDVWLHARTGEWILEHGHVPETNVLSPIHTGYPSVHDKWAFQVLTHLVFDGAGPLGVYVVRLALLLALFLCLWSTARRLGASPAMSLLVLSLALVAARSRFMFRPDLASLLLQAVVLRVVLVLRPDGRRSLRLLLPLAVVWVNVHGYFLLGVLCVGAVAAGHALRGAAGRPTALRFFLAALLMLAASLLNPAGLAGVLHPFAILQDLARHEAFYTSTIDEFWPTFADDPRQPYDRLAFFVLGGGAVLALGGLAVGAWRRPTRARAVAGPARAVLPADLAGERLVRLLLPALVLLVMFGAMSRGLRRSMAVFAVGMAPLTAAAASSQVRRLRPGSRAASWLAGDAPAGELLPAGLVLVIALGELTDFTSVHDGLDRQWGLGMSGTSYADDGIDFIARELPQAGVFTAFRYGSTFTGRRWPEQAASTNGNTHGYPTEWLIEVMDAVSLNDPSAFDRLCDRHRLDVALIPMEAPLAPRLLRRDDWQLVCLGRSEAVFVREGAVPEAWLAAHGLEQTLAGGGLPPLPRTPRLSGPLGLPRVLAPSTELAGAQLLRGAGYPRQAEALVQEALALAPDDPLALALAGLLAYDRGDMAAARPWLERSLRCGLSLRWQPEVRRALAGT